MEDKLIVDNEHEIEIKKQFEIIGIPDGSYPEYSDPYSFGNSFKKCTILKSVPYTTTDSCELDR